MKRTIIILLGIIMMSACSHDSVRTGKPVIGISSGYSESNGKVTLNSTYVEAVIRGGGIPYVLPLVRDEKVAAMLLDGLDGIILSGGEDIDPAYFGEELLDNGTVSINGPRDTSDVFITKEALKRKIPVLAICRGEQVLNVVLGGNLYQDIPSQLEDHIVHSQDEPGTVGTQSIALAEGTYVKKLIGLDSLCVNSFHHQAVKDTAPGLKVVSRAADGIVEAYEGLPELNVIGTQFHPEIFTSAGDPVFVKFFQDLVKRAETYRKDK